MNWDGTVIIAFLGWLGTTISSICCYMAGTKKTIYRIEQLEKKVEKHNNVAERMIAAEQAIKSHQHQINELKGEIAVD